MKNPAIVLLCLAIALAVFCSVFMWNPPSPRFYPIEHVWRMPGGPAPGPAMGWYGRTGVALGASVFAASATGVALCVRDSRKRIALGAPAVYAIVVMMSAIFAATCAGIVHEQRGWFAKASAPPKPDHEY